MWNQIKDSLGIIAFLAFIALLMYYERHQEQESIIGCRSRAEVLELKSDPCLSSKGRTEVGKRYDEFVERQTKRRRTWD